MSWLPSNDPILGDPRSCDALELVIVPRTRDLGDGFEVRRALPHGKRQMVGPFIFFDHFGPVQFIDRKSTRLNSSHEWISYAVFCLKKNKKRSYLSHSWHERLFRAGAPLVLCDTN